MAIVKSIFLGKARKSAGGGTFRTVRGRTILSEKRGPSGTATRGEGGETVYQFNFALISRYASLHRADINVSFDTTKYGSCGNYFFKINRTALELAFADLYNSYNGSAEVTNKMIEDAVVAYATENPTNIYRVRKTGCTTKYLTGAWKTSDNPDGSITPTPPAGEDGVTYDGKVHRLKTVASAELVRSQGVKVNVTGGEMLLTVAAAKEGDKVTLYSAAAENDEETEVVEKDGTLILDLIPDPSVGDETYNKFGLKIGTKFYAFVD